MTGGHVGGGRGRTFGTAPWRRAPGLLLRQPVVALALAGAAAVLGVAAASGPLLLSQIGTASLHEAAHAHCPELAMPSVTVRALGSGGGRTGGYTNRVNTAADQAAARVYSAAALPRPQDTVIGSGVISRAAGSMRAPQHVNIYARPGALAHVQRLSSAGGRGIWLTAYAARQFGVRAGGTVYVEGQPVRVVGTYRSLDAALDPAHSLPRYWCSWHDIILPSSEKNSSPTFAIATDAEIAIRDAASVQSTWFSRSGIDGLTLGAATRDAARGQIAGNRFVQQLHSNSPSGSVAGSASDLTAEVSASYSSTVAQAHHVRDGIRGAIVPIAGGGVAVAMLLVTGAGLFWTIRRRREIRLLVSRGVGPVHIAGKTVLETGPWVVLGAAAGFALGVVLVRVLGPSPSIESDAEHGALLGIGLAVIASLSLIGSVGGLAGRPNRTHGLTVAGWARRVPWELGLLAAAAAVFSSAGGSGLTVDHNTVQLRPALLAFPLLGMTGVLLLGIRLLRSGLPALRRSATRRGMPAFLAANRISAAPVTALAVVVGIALPCAIVVYAEGLEHSLRSSVRAKYETNVGAPHVLRAAPGSGRDLQLRGTGTQVSRIEEEPMTNGEDAQVIGVDPASFAQFAYTDAEQRAAVRTLTFRRGMTRVPALVVNNSTDRPISTVRILDDRLDLAVRGSFATFPGLRNSLDPMIVVNRAALDDAPAHVERSEQVWTDNHALAAARRVLAAQGTPVWFEIDSNVLVSDTGLLPVVWILDYLRALAVLVGLVAVTAVVFSLSARAAQQAVAFVMAVRMGVSPRSHLVSLVIELGLLVGTGWLFGSGLAEGAIALVYRSLDVLPEFPPGPAFVIQSRLILLLGVSAVTIVLGASGFAQAVSRRACAADVLRAP